MAVFLWYVTVFSILMHIEKIYYSRNYNCILLFMM